VPQALLDQLVLIAQLPVLRVLQGLQEPRDLQVLLVLTALFQDQQEPQVQQEQQVLREQLDHKVLQEMSDLLVLLEPLAQSVQLEIQDLLE
jgi:hypothetical protein